MTRHLEHVERTYVLVLHGDAARVCELFEPRGESKWAETWNPVFIHPSTGETVEGMVFATSHSVEPDTVWALSVYDPARFHLEYIRLNPSRQVARIVVRCQPAGRDVTQAEVTYAVTALSEAGNQGVAALAHHPGGAAR